jgi:hypothetical protein
MYQFSLLKYFHATYFFALRPSSGVWKNNELYSFNTGLSDAKDLLLVVLLDRVTQRVHC